MSTSAILILSITLGIITFLASFFAAKIDAAQSVMFVFLVEMVVGIYSIDKHMRHRPSQRFEHLENERSIIQKAQQMKTEANRSIHCIWCSMDYDEDLIKHFEGFRNIKATVFRLINVKKHPKDVTKHLNGFIKEIKEGKYVVTSTSHEAFEFLVIDKAAQVQLLIPHPTKYGFSEGIYSADIDFANAICRMYEELEKKGNNLDIPYTANDEEAKHIIDKWVTENSN
jgi:hypothetical protein